MNIITTIEEMARRLEKAKELVEAGKVHRVEGLDDVFVVEGNGEKENGTQRRFYLVNHECQCPDFHQRKELHKGWCKHRLAVELVKHGWKPNGKGEKPSPSSQSDIQKEER